MLAFFSLPRLLLGQRQQQRGLAVKAVGSGASQAVKEKMRLAKLNPKAWVSAFQERKTRRSGVLALKVGMTHMFDEFGRMSPLTVLKLEDNIVLAHRTVEQNGYTAVVVGAGPVKQKHLSRSVIGQYVKWEMPLRKHQVEFRCSPDALIPVGTRIEARHFMVGQMVDIAGVTQGKGFQGVMKRWGFSGFPASHGTSLVHRSAGATGQRQDPGKVSKGKKMAGKMGNDRLTVQNVLLYAVDPARDLMFVRGAVPGKAGGLCEVTDAIKMPSQFRLKEMHIPVPTFVGERVPYDEKTHSPAKWLIAKMGVGEAAPAAPEGETAAKAAKAAPPPAGGAAGSADKKKKA